MLNFHGLHNMAQVLLPLKNPDLSHRQIVLQHLQLAIFFSKFVFTQPSYSYTKIHILTKLQNSTKLSRAPSQSNLSFNFESFLPNHTKVAAILIFCHICQKGIFFTFCFVIYLLLNVYFSKYLQFPLNTITHRQKYVNEHVFLEDNGR